MVAKCRRVPRGRAECFGAVSRVDMTRASIGVDGNREDRLARAGGIETGGGFSFSCAQVLPGSPEGQWVGLYEGGR